MQGKKVTVFGGSGFVGRRIVQRLTNAGAIVKVGVRDPENAIFLKTMGAVGQVVPVHVNVTKFDEVKALCRKADIVINLVGIIFEKKTQKFQKVHINGAENIARAARDCEVSRFIHMSAIGANSHSSSKYAKTKGKAEEIIHKYYPDATIIRPTIIFGSDDRFFNRFAQMLVLCPLFALVGGGKTKMQPIYVSDVADAVMNALETKKSIGKTYELGGPEIYTFKELLQFLLATIHRRGVLIPVPFFIAKIMGYLLQTLPTPPLTADQVELMKKDSIVSKKALGLKDLGIVPKSIKTIVPEYLKIYRPRF